jgi:hypothetical protein
MIDPYTEQAIHKYFTMNNIMGVTIVFEDDETQDVNYNNPYHVIELINEHPEYSVFMPIQTTDINQL